MNNDLTNKLCDIADKLNRSIDASQLNFPVLEGYNNIENINPEVIVCAKSKEGYIEQIIFDGKLIEDETLETHIESVINSIKDFMKQNNFESPDTNIVYFKDVKTDNFNFKLYIQNNILTVNNQKKISRQILSFFIDPKSNIFYQLSLCSLTENLLTTNICYDVIDIENDLITKYLNDLTLFILNNISYK